jgi:RNA polymerase sigma-70 factor (ECF subfamily)
MAWDPNEMDSWLGEVRSGNADAARALVDHLYPCIIRIVRGHLPWRMEETDLAQEIFLKIFKRLDQYQTRTGIPLEHWVSRIALTTCLDALRVEQRRPELRLADMSEVEVEWMHYLTSDAADTPYSSAGAGEIVRKLLGQLKSEDRLVLTLLDLEEKSIREISEITGWSQTGVKVRAFRARRRLRKVAEVFRQRNLI